MKKVKKFWFVLFLVVGLAAGLMIWRAAAPQTLQRLARIDNEVSSQTDEMSRYSYEPYFVRENFFPKISKPADERQ